MPEEGPAPTGPVPKPGKYLKVSLYLKKQPHVTDDYFHAYWANNHLVPAFGNKNFMDRVRRYNQVHVTPEYRKMAEAFKIPVMDYDGIAEVWVDSIDDWMSIVSDADFVKEVAADEPHFIMAPIHVMLSYDNQIIGEDWKPKALPKDEK